MHPKIKQVLQVALSLGIALWIFWFLYRDIEFDKYLENIHKKEFEYNHTYKYCNKIETGSDNIRIDTIDYYKNQIK